MKKVLVAFLLIVILVTFCACSVSSGSFMSKSQVRSLVKRYPNPQAVVTLSYKAGSDNIEVKATYNLLLQQAPIAVTRFIQIANEGGYNGTLADTLDNSYHYMVMGRYKPQEDNSKRYDNVRLGDVTFAGEFKSNGYSEPKGGYAQFKVFSLAMYHTNTNTEDASTAFNSANGTLILALGEQTLNSDNYAVFAEFVSMTVKINDGEARQYREGNVPSSVMSNLTSFTGKSTVSVYDPNDENASSVSVSVMSTTVTLAVEILGDYNWSKLPTIR